MGYGFLMDDWVWSFSRLKCYEQCPHAFYMKYLDKVPQEGNHYADFGSFVHKILQKFYTGELKKNELVSYYLKYYDEEVLPERNEKVSVTNYLNGLKYFRNIEDFNKEIIGVERRVDGEISGNKFTGYIDLLYKESDGGIVIRDHKSHPIKEKNPTKPRKTDEDFDKYALQLYIYANMIRKELRTPVKYIEFNCFKTGTVPRELASSVRELDAVRWVCETIGKIKYDEDFMPNPEYYYCNNLCEFRSVCDYRKFSRGD